MNRQFYIAKKIAQKSNSKFRLGCVLVKKGRIISIGWNNMVKTNPKCKTYGNFIHSELHCLLNTEYSKTRGSIVYIYRETKGGELAQSRPCPVCYEALRIAGVKKIRYTIKSGYAEESIKYGK
jgi:deoxycytidylate deaminase